MTIETSSNVLLDFFKTLADASRLRLVGLLSAEERSVEELATLLELRAPTVSHHLNRLKALGIVRMRSDGTTHLYRLDVDALRALSRQALALESGAAGAEVTPDLWEQKVLRSFCAGERLKEIPASQKKREVVLRWLLERFSLGQRYSEREVNAILVRHHPDFAALRRYLVDAGLLVREHSIYWRPVAEPAGASG